MGHKRTIVERVFERGAALGHLAPPTNGRWPALPQGLVVPGAAASPNQGPPWSDVAANGSHSEFWVVGQFGRGRREAPCLASRLRGADTKAGLRTGGSPLPGHRVPCEWADRTRPLEAALANRARSKPLSGATPAAAASTPQADRARSHRDAIRVPDDLVRDASPVHDFRAPSCLAPSRDVALCPGRDSNPQALSGNGF
jgi:hypothetical protein